MENRVDLFHSLVVVGDGCWEWQGKTDRDGYGRFFFKRKMRGAHRLAYAFANGMDIDDLSPYMLVCHSCDNPKCCRPGHLFVGTTDDNNKDRMRKGRNTQGEGQHLSRLTETTVREIRVLSAQGYMQVELALMYNVTQGTIGKVIRRETWKHID